MAIRPNWPAIEQRMTALGLSLADLARKACVAPNTLRGWEQSHKAGKPYTAQRHTIRKVARALEVASSDIVLRERAETLPGSSRSLAPVALMSAAIASACAEIALKVGPPKDEPYLQLLQILGIYGVTWFGVRELKAATRLPSTAEPFLWLVATFYAAAMIVLGEPIGKSGAAGLQWLWPNLDSGANGVVTFIHSAAVVAGAYVVPRGTIMGLRYLRSWL
jgi:transcriptional regulator with XRE-family HTH domain